MTDVTETGLKLFSEILGQGLAEQLRQSLDSDDFGAAIGKLSTDFVFGSVWAREGLERKQRSLVVIGTLIAQRQSRELKNHIRIGLANGLTVREIEEALIQTIPYVGAVMSAMTAIIEVLPEQGLDTKTRTAEERGML